MEIATIAAIATPVGSGGIGIIKISGPDARRVAAALFRRPKTRPPYSAPPQVQVESPPLRPYHLHYGNIIDPIGREVVDEVLLAFMPAPRSYTREDVIEIQSHGGPVVMQRLFELVLDCGVRLAEPGEFTQRAFLNGRIDLTQAEAVADLICAKTQTAAKIAASQLGGEFSTRLEPVIGALDNIRVLLEARIEFEDETDVSLENNAVLDDFQRHVIQPIRELISQFEEGHLLRDGLKLTIVGRPNVGKSSLLNQLLKKDKAIVADIPGTTRDVVEDFFTVRGVPIHICDTAGLRSSEDPIEVLGMNRTRQNIDNADLILFIIDASQPYQEEDRAICELLIQKRVIVVLNKMDLIQNSGNPHTPAIQQKYPKIMLSALTGKGLRQLKDAIAENCLKNVGLRPGSSIVPNLRQKQCLVAALDAAKHAEALIENGIEGCEEMIVQDISSATNELRQIRGEDKVSDILNQVFERFCIGK